MSNKFDKFAQLFTSIYDGRFELEGQMKTISNKLDELHDQIGTEMQQNSGKVPHIYFFLSLSNKLRDFAEIYCNHK